MGTTPGPSPITWGEGLDTNQLNHLELTASNSWRFHFNPKEDDGNKIDGFIKTSAAINAWKKALTVREKFYQPIEWSSYYYPCCGVELVDSAEDLDSLVHEHAYGDMRLLIQCLLHQERLTGTVDPEVPLRCVYHRWKSLKQYVNLLIYLSNFSNLDLAKALDFPQSCQVDTNLAHVCELVARIVASQEGSWESGAVWFLLAVFSEERYCRHSLRQEARRLRARQRRALETLIARQPWFEEQDPDLVEDLVPDLNTANL